MHTDSHFPGISGSTLKLIAIFSMLIDHTGATVLRAILAQPSFTALPEQRLFWLQIYNLSRRIGRLAFPIFCFLIVEGFLHTRNAWRYAWRLFLFALVSEIPFDLALKGNWFFPQKQNVYFTLLIGLLVLIGFRWAAQIPLFTSQQSKNPSRQSASSAKHLADTVLRCLLFSGILAAGMYLAKWIDTDYSYKGVFLIAMLYLTRRERLFQCATGAAAVAWELPAPLGLIPVYLYNGKRGLRMKYFFYWFYPVHLLVLHGIAKYLIPLF